MDPSRCFPGIVIKDLLSFLDSLELVFNNVSVGDVRWLLPPTGGTPSWLHQYNIKNNTTQKKYKDSKIKKEETFPRRGGAVPVGSTR